MASAGPATPPAVPEQAAAQSQPVQSASALASAEDYELKRIELLNSLKHLANAKALQFIENT